MKPTKLWLDTEFNEHGGDLISLALVNEDMDFSFYEVLHCEHPGEWVRANVMLILQREPITLHDFQKQLEQYLLSFPAVHIIADWPDDVAYFCRALIIGPGQRINTPPITFEIVRDDAPSRLPHNALADAEGMAEVDIGKAKVHYSI